MENGLGCDAGSKENSEIIHQLPRMAEYFGERGYDWHNLTAANILKRYLVGEICVGIKVSCPIQNGNRQHFYAFFRLYMGSGSGNGKIVLSDWSAARFDAHSNDIRGLADDRKEAVFVADVELMNDFNGSSKRVGAIIRLHSNDPAKGRAGNSLYLSTITRLFEFFPTPANGKLMVVDGALSSSARKLHNKVVETRTTLMNDLTGDHGEPQRDRSSALDPEYMLRGIALDILFSDVRARITCQELVNLGVEVLDTFIGPLKLRHDTI